MNNGATNDMKKSATASDDEDKKQYNTMNNGNDTMEDNNTDLNNDNDDVSGDKKTDNNNGNNSVVVSELIKILKEEMYLLSIGCISLLCSTMSNSAVPKALGKVIDNSKSCSTSTSFSSIYSDVPLALILGGGLSSFIRTFTLNKVANNIDYKLRQRLFKSLLYNSSEAQKETVTTTSTNLVLMNEDIPEISKMLTTTSANIIRNLSSITYSSYNMLSIDKTLCLVSLSIIPFIGSSAVIFLKILSKFKKQLKDNMLSCNEFWEERCNLLYTIKFYNRQEYEIESCNDILHANRNLGNKYSLWYGGFMGSMFISTCLALLGVVSFGMNRISNNSPKSSLSSGNFTSFASYSILLGLGTTGFLDTLSKLRHGFESAKRVFNVILSSSNNTAIKNDDDINEITINPTSIVISNVSYTYPGSKTPTLQNINLTLQKGKTYAIVGKNGVGKSTLVNILSGFTQPTNGTVSLLHNNSNKTEKTKLHNLNQNSQRLLIGIIPQSPHLFNTSVYNNITYSKPNASSEEVKSLQKLCNIDDIDTTLNNIGKNGCCISGGQRQRIALARVLLHNPKLLLILDEPMNNLDSDGMDMLLNDTLLSNNKEDVDAAAIVLVTHNKEYLKNVNEIIVLGNGDNDDHDSSSSIIGVGNLNDLEMNGILDQAM